VKRLWLLLLPAFAFAGPPYDVTVTFSPPVSGGAPGGYNLYVDDCAVTGAVGAPVSPAYDPSAPITVPPSSGTFSGKTYTGLIIADGTYQFCVRAVNLAGEQPDPGETATVIIDALQIPGTINGLGIQITCDATGCTVTSVIS